MQIAETTQKNQSDKLTHIRSLMQDDLHAVDQLVIQELVSDIPLIKEVTQHIIKSGGKRLRPLLVLLSARACGYHNGKEHLELAAIIEFVHTATLLHDDVVDESLLRRGQETANAVWGNQASVLVGDFLYSRSFQLLTRRSHVAIMQALANTTNAIAEGEVLQLMNQHNSTITEDDYMAVIYRKTAALFSSAAEIGAILGSNNAATHRVMQQYGLHLGLAFQIIDDVLDYAASSTEIGKNIGDDLAEGKTTLPLIFVLKNADESTTAEIRRAIETGDRTALPLILSALEKTGALEYAREKARHHIQLAQQQLHSLPHSSYRTALVDFANFAIDRRY